MRSYFFQSFCFRKFLFLFLFFYLISSFVCRSFFSTPYAWGDVSKIYDLYKKLSYIDFDSRVRIEKATEAGESNILLMYSFYSEKLSEAAEESKRLIIGDEGQLIKVLEVYGLYQRKLEEAEEELKKKIGRVEGSIRSLAHKRYEEKMDEVAASIKRLMGEGSQLTEVYELSRERLVEVSKMIRMKELLVKSLINQFYMKRLADAEGEAREKIGEGDRLAEVYKLYQEKISEAGKEIQTKLDNMEEQVLKGNELACKSVF